jgi:3-oxoacyl-[acyl-carrier protein] reductase
MSINTSSLKGKYALVTGAGKGIGQAIAIALGKEGAEVACVSRTESDLQETVRTIEQDGGRGRVLPVDVTDLQAVRRCFSELAESWPRLDLIFINAGGNLGNSEVEHSDPEIWKKIIDLNLNGAYYCAKYAIPLLKKSSDAKIIATGSGMGRKGKIGSSAYSCGKAGLWMLVRILAQELAPAGISVTELVPGPVETNQEARGIKNWRQSFEKLDEWIKTPEEVVPLALFLATQPAGGPTAQSYSLMRRDN